jgi:hypothetical protein
MKALLQGLAPPLHLPIENKQNDNKNSDGEEGGGGSSNQQLSEKGEPQIVFLEMFLLASVCDASQSLLLWRTWKKEKSALLC